MKKVLFATTALVATAGVAAADVTFGGYGRFGIKYNENDANPQGVFPGNSNGSGVSSTDLTHRLRLQIDMTAESDAGVTVGARVRIQQDAGANGANNSGAGINGVRYFARSGGFEVGVGNIFGALESMPGMYPVDMGLTGLGYDYVAYGYHADNYSSGGAGNDNGAEVMWSGGNISAHLSYSDGLLGNDRIAAYVGYTWNGWTFALGAQDSNTPTDTDWVISAGGSFGVADVTLAYADNGTSGDRIVLAAGFDVGAATNVEVYYADDDLLDDSYGIDFNHDLGGGVSLRGGIVNRFGGNMQADLGVRFNF